MTTARVCIRVRNGLDFDAMTAEEKGASFSLFTGFGYFYICAKFTEQQVYSRSYQARVLAHLWVLLV